MKTKILLLSLLLALSSSIFAFKIKVSISVSQQEASIYVNNEFKAKGSCVFDLNEAKKLIVRVELPGYITQTRTYQYQAKEKSGFISYTRNNDLDIKFDLKPEPQSSKSHADEAAGATVQSQELSKLTTLKEEELITGDESLTLKDNLYSNKNSNATKIIGELTKLRKLLNEGMMTKPDFMVVKTKIMNNQYDYTKGNNAPDQFDELKGKKDSGNFSNEDIERLRKRIIDSYR